MRKCNHNWDTEQKLVFGPIQIEQVKIDESLCPESIMFLENQNAMHIQEEVLQNRKVWEKFKSIHPDTKEVPVFTPENVHRWLYHIREYFGRGAFKSVKLDTLDLEKIRTLRVVKNFAGFSKGQQESYTEIAKCFPGVQVYACGSQVRGDWFDFCLPNAETIIAARQKAGMRVDRYSDFDFWVAGGVEPSSQLPSSTDRFRGKFNEKEMVAIPIYNGV